MQIFMYEVWDNENDIAVTRVRVLEDNTLEVETNTDYDSSRIVLTPKQAREFARDLNAAARVAGTK